MKKVKTQDPTPTQVENKKPTVAEVIENLKLQINQHQTMLVKAQGALEVLEQIEEF